MKILFIGDIFAKQGRKAINALLPALVKKHKVDFVIVNAENCTHGRSLNIRHYLFLKSIGVNFFTFGNHTWDNEQIYDILKNDDTIRPLNIKSNLYQAKVGEGSRVIKIKNKKIRITNLLGLSAACKNMQTNPFLLLDEKLNDWKGKQDIHIIDFHANSTSEKNAMLAAYNSKVSAILGTHSHVQTADARIYNNTAYITDVGMTGPSNGIIGAQPKTILQMYRGEVLHFKLDPDKSSYQLNAVLLTFDNKTNKPKSIKRIYLIQEQN